MGEGYTYTTLSGGPDQPVRIQVSFYLDAEAWIRVPGTGTGEQLLSISHGYASMSVGPAKAGVVTAEDARIARTLADQAAVYAAEVERLAARTAPAADGTA
jgi:hypothetical protein